MSGMSRQINEMQTGLEAADPYSHVDRDPWNRSYRRIALHDIAEDFSEECFRHFSLSVLFMNPSGLGGEGNRRFEAVIELAVLYPLAENGPRAEEYFSAEVELVRRLFESPDAYGDNTRYVGHGESNINRLDEKRLQFIHTFDILLDEDV